MIVSWTSVCSFDASTPPSLAYGPCSINFCVYDSTWESANAFQLDHDGNVDAWVNNDHLGFEVFYVFKGVVHKYRPDFLIRLKTGDYLILETKGQDTDQDKTKLAFLDEWVIAVNEHGGFGKWSWAVSRQAGSIVGILSGNAD